MFVDIHCHILPGIDDGAKDMDHAVEMCRIAEEEGIKEIIATPHFIEGDLHNDKVVVQEKVKELMGVLEELHINVGIHPGNEVFITPNLVQLVKDGHVSSLNHTKYILVEFPMMSIPDYAQDIFYDLQIEGYTPIIAHPERNMIVAEKPDKLFEFISRGALAQVNSTSISGIFGKKVKETALFLLKHNMVHFMATDAHTARGRSPKMNRALNVIQTQLGAKTADMLMYNNRSLLNGEDITVLEPLKGKTDKGIFTFRDLKKLGALLFGSHG
ncbi:CpsB/CapC family capsule biosynthesis tyrosine phosphatase [Petroclostridium sp. X23]|uniref:tyrosine-protein phosphatase n=1 Tax=Petroclostridium sp. X23 TaxID=3045146 RepID=UPI0024ADD965|nr:CpsB/CapC family capsule biosynthesis tyrosine phosphatase [Petroclostridium sp. X23]WHH57521.1 exopolysaccharide biosynthesis protein [Petroclostridium sp. X23]